LEVPLQIDADFVLGPDTALLSYYSSLRASNFNISGRATFAEYSVAAFQRILVGAITKGELTISNATISSDTLSVGDPSGTPGVVNQYSGVNNVTGTNVLWINPYGAYNLYGGTLIAPATAAGGGTNSQSPIDGGKIGRAHV